MPVCTAMPPGSLYIPALPYTQLPISHLVQYPHNPKLTCARAHTQDKESKLGYLNKIIKCVEIASGSTIDVRCDV